MLSFRARYIQQFQSKQQRQKKQSIARGSYKWNICFCSYYFTYSSVLQHWCTWICTVHKNKYSPWIFYNLEHRHRAWDMLRNPVVGMTQVTIYQPFWKSYFSVNKWFPPLLMKAKASSSLHAIVFTRESVFFTRLSYLRLRAHLFPSEDKACLCSLKDFSGG